MTKQEKKKLSTVLRATEYLFLENTPPTVILSGARNSQREFLEESKDPVYFSSSRGQFGIFHYDTTDDS